MRRCINWPTFLNPPSNSLAENINGKICQVTNRYQDNQKYGNILLIIPNIMWVYIIYMNWRTSLVHSMFLFLQLDNGSQCHHGHRFSNQIRNGSCVAVHYHRFSNYIGGEENFVIGNASQNRLGSIMCKFPSLLTQNTN